MRKIFTNAIMSLAVFAAATVAVNAETINLESAETSGPGWTTESFDGGTRYVITGDVTVTGKNDAAQLFVPKDASVEITLDGVSIINDKASPMIVESAGVDGGAATLVLVGANELIVGKPTLSAAAVVVEQPAALTIKGDGQLMAYGAGVNGSKDENAYGGGAGIGANPRTTGNGAKEWVYSGDITIESGTIIAQGGYNAASIGGGYYGHNGNYTQNGGVVVGITVGSGSHGGPGNITINGGTLYLNWSLGVKVYNNDDPDYAGTWIEYNGGNVFVNGGEGIHQADEYGDAFGHYIYGQEDDPETGLPYKKYGVAVTSTAFYSHSDAERDPHNTEFAGLDVTLYGGDELYGVAEGEIYTYGDLIVPDFAIVNGENDVDGSFVTWYHDGVLYANEGENVNIAEGTLETGAAYGRLYNIGQLITEIETPGVAPEKPYVVGSDIIIPAGASKVAVYGITGQLIGGTKGLAKGVYVVVVDGAATKVVVK